MAELSRIKFSSFSKELSLQNFFSLKDEFLSKIGNLKIKLSIASIFKYFLGI